MQPSAVSLLRVVGLLLLCNLLQLAKRPGLTHTLRLDSKQQMCLVCSINASLDTYRTTSLEASREGNSMLCSSKSAETASSE
ncbi:hypothetical protein COO60DRAFT_213098 [Scenedesmus sp. NREL 46B-D3]|nr:hypothetical protein COO60DRAFT_213098 [Scenedesmus sp. NREL 46B-D3]